MQKNEEHQSEYSLYARTAIVLLLLTALNISMAAILHNRFVAGLNIAIALVQATIALTWFMHLKFDNKLFRWLVIAVFLLFAIVIVITFFDYLFR